MSDWIQVGEKAILDNGSIKGRFNTSINGRFITIIRHPEKDGKLYCLDSVCHHAGGPLVLGDIEEVDGKACLVCPWHFYHVSIVTGEKYYQRASPGEDGRLHAAEWTSVGPRQRTHDVESRDDGKIWVKLNLQGSYASDEYATKVECGARVKSGALRVAQTERDGSRSPNRSASPMRGTPPASPRASILMEGEDVWPEDLVDRRSSSAWKRMHMQSGATGSRGGSS